MNIFACDFLSGTSHTTNETEGDERILNISDIRAHGDLRARFKTSARPGVKQALERTAGRITHIKYAHHVAV